MVMPMMSPVMKKMASLSNCNSLCTFCVAWKLTWREQ